MSKYTLQDAQKAFRSPTQFVFVPWEWLDRIGHGDRDALSAFRAVERHNRRVVPKRLRLHNHILHAFRDPTRAVTCSDCGTVESGFYAYVTGPVGPCRVCGHPLEVPADA